MKLISRRLWLVFSSATRCFGFTLLMLTALTISFSPQHLQAAASYLDPTFGGDGKVNTDFGDVSDGIYAIALQPDGKYVVAGFAFTGSWDIALARYNSDGSLDTTFDGDGMVTTNFPGSEAYAYTMALQPDGKIVVAGIIVFGGHDFVLVRYNPDGSLDTTFDGDGKLTTDFAGGFDHAYDIAVLPDGKILVAGVASIAFDSNFALARYNPDGSLDTTFDGDGKLTTDFAASSDGARAMALQPDGKIVLAGQSENANINYFAVARYNPDGSLDTTFDGDGKLTTDFGSSAYSDVMALQPDGKILAAGYLFSAGDFALARYNTDGSLDTTFNGDGKLTTDFGDFEQAYAMVVQLDGKIIAAGATIDDFTGDFALARYNPDGSLDTSFDDDGKLITDFATGYDEAQGMLLQPDGKIVVAGYASFSNNGDFGLARYQLEQNCLFCDDFENGVIDPNWTYEKPAWTESGGSLIGTPVRQKAIAIASPLFAGCLDCSMEASVMTAGGAFNKAWIYFHRVDKRNLVELLIKEENDKIVLKQRINKFIVAKAKASVAINPNTPYTFRIAYDGSQYTVSMNGTLLISMTPGGLVNSATVGFAFKSTTGSVGHIVVN